MAYFQATALSVAYISSVSMIYSTQNLNGCCIFTYYRVVTTLLVACLTLSFWMTEQILFAPTSSYTSLVQRLPII